MHTQTFTDAQQSALGFVTPAFYNIERTVYQRRYPSYDYASLIPVITEGSEWARGTLFRSSDVTGKAEFLSGKAQDLPYADVTGEQLLKSFELAGIGYEWTLEEVETAAMEGRNLSDEKAQAARKVAESFLWKIAMAGDAEKNWTGLINDPIATSGSAIADGTGSSALWANKDADKILRDVNNAIGGMTTGSSDVELADTVLMPFDRWNRLATTRLAGEGSVSILKFLQENNAYTAETGVPLTVRALRALTNAGTSGQARMVAYRRDPEVVRFHLPMPHRFLAPFQKSSMTFEVAGIMRTGGTEIRLPKAVAYIDGI